MADGLYALWRMRMWLNGYGTYDAIDAAVQNGELVAGKRYPTKRVAPTEGETDD
jgi:hypothetical protein